MAEVCLDIPETVVVIQDDPEQVITDAKPELIVDQGVTGPPGADGADGTGGITVFNGAISASATTAVDTLLKVNFKCATWLICVTELIGQKALTYSVNAAHNELDAGWNVFGKAREPVANPLKITTVVSISGASFLLSLTNNESVAVNVKVLRVAA